MNLLICTEFVELRTGAELYVLELAMAMHARGHRVRVYARRLGLLAEALRDAGIVVVDDLRRLRAQPDVIQAQQFFPAMQAMLHFRDVPGVFVCHSSDMWIDDAPVISSLQSYIGVSRVCMARLRREGAPVDRIRFLPNWVDVERFRMRGPLPDRPRCALVFSNRATEANFLAALRGACGVAGIDLDVAGLRMKSLTSRPEEILPHYDLVFAKGRAAMEALAVGTAVVLCDEAGLGPLVTSDQVDRLLAMNCGYEALSEPHTQQGVLREIERYSADDARTVSGIVRASRASSVVFDAWESVLEEARRAPRRGPSAAEFAVAALRFASRWPKWVVAEQYWRRFGRFTQLSQMPLIRALLPR